MDTLSILKKRRQELNLTQAEVAKVAGISQPTYQNYETGRIAIPSRKLNRIAKALKLDKGDILGLPPPIAPSFPNSRGPSTNPLVAAKSNVPNDPKLVWTHWDDEDLTRLYWGELAISFTQGAPIVVSIDREECQRLYDKVMPHNGEFFDVHTMSNQIIGIRRAAVTNIRFVENGGEILCEAPSPGCWRSSKRYWTLVEALADHDADIDELCEEYGEDRVVHTAREIGRQMHADIDTLIEAEAFPETERAEKLKEAGELFAEAVQLARGTAWQFSNGKITRTRAADDEQLYRLFWMLDCADPTFKYNLFITHDGEHYFFNCDELDYITFPAHAYWRITDAETLEIEKGNEEFARIAAEKLAKKRRKAKGAVRG
jgi:transcriptional regulator with XRE-family HTH domain